MNRVLVLLVVATVIAASCSLLRTPTTGGGEPPRPIDIPTSALVPPDIDTIEGGIRLEGLCLLLDGPGDDVIPIWPSGYNASSGSRFLGLRNASNDESMFAAGGEALELHGEWVDVPPPDTRVPVACAGYRLFHVREAFNRS